MTTTEQSISSKPAQQKWLWLAAALILLDQVIKHWAVSAFDLYERLSILPVFDLTLAYNTGAAFSFLSDAGGWQRWFFCGIAAVVSVVLVIWIRRLKEGETWLAIALTFVLGGALGNLYDRAVLGHVVDFILLHYKGSYFPAFNIADIAINIGAFMLIVDTFRHRKQAS
ncbi:signal peptidase II [Endozoicomonadaceae bacterium StTr2]